MSIMESMIRSKLNHQFRDILRNAQFKNVSGIRAINTVCYIISQRKEDLYMTSRILNENGLHILNIYKN